MLTPKLSLRRNNVHAVYGGLIDDLYNGKVGKLFKAPAADQADT
jgi:hypothetical protein